MGAPVQRYICINCGYIYDRAHGDPTQGILPGVAFEALPEQWVCPLCYVGRNHFDPLD